LARQRAFGGHSFSDVYGRRLGVLLADDFFRLSHYDVTGQSLLHPAALSTGLAAALLGELVWTGHLGVKAGHVFPRQGEPPDELSARVLALLRRENHPLPTWLEFFALDAVVEVAKRLENAGHIRVERSRRLVRRTVTYVPTSQLEASRPLSVLATRLLYRLHIDDWYVCLAGLMAATGLHTTVLAGASPESHTYLRALVARLEPAMQELIAHTEVLVGAAVLAHRT
jgi:hypothetical protein